MSKTILFDQHARRMLRNGINKVGFAVTSTFGYGGKNVLISRNKIEAPDTTRDGVTVAKAIFLQDPIENAAALLTKSVAEKTVEIAGDGTTNSIVLFQRIVNDAFFYIERGANSVEIKKGIAKAAEVVVAELKKQSTSIGKSIQMIKQVATVSANNDEEIGNLIASAFEKIGNDGILLIEESKSTKTFIRIDDGYQFERGWSSPFWAYGTEKQICELHSPFILLYDGKIERFGELRGILEGMMQAKRRDILIIADSVEGEAFDTLITNKLKGVLNVVAIQAPSYGERRKQMMEDIAILTGGQYISQDYALTLEDANINSCGSCEKIIVTKDLTTIVNGDGTKEDIQSRSALIGSLIEQSVSDMEVKMLQQRLAKLNGSIAVFCVGGVTETEMKEKKDRVDDAIRATKCAIEEGIVAGGGVALLRCADELVLLETKNKDQRIGVDIIEGVLQAPIIQILLNAGIPYSKPWEKSILSYLKKEKNTTSSGIIKQLHSMGSGSGYNVKTERIENMFEAGIIDPTKVIRSAFENAVSIACMVIISECLVVEVGE